MILYRWIRYEAKAILTSSSSSLVSTTNGTVGCTKGSCGGRICRICKYSMCIIGHCCLPLSPRQLAGPGNLSKRYVYTYTCTRIHSTSVPSKVQYNVTHVGLRLVRLMYYGYGSTLYESTKVRKYFLSYESIFVLPYFRTESTSVLHVFRTRVQF